MALVFNCVYGGTNLINSSPPSGEHAWSSVSNEEAGAWEKKTDAGGWNGKTNYSQYLARTTLRTEYVNFSSPASDRVSGIIALQLIAMPSSSGSVELVYRLSDSGGSTIVQAKFKNNATQMQILAYMRDTSSVAQLVSTWNISIGTWYQFRYKAIANTSGGFVCELWNELGTSQIGSTGTAGFTTWAGDGDNWNTCEIGHSEATDGIQQGKFDKIQIYNDYALPSLYTVAAANAGDFKSCERGVMRGVGRRIVA